MEKSYCLLTPPGRSAVATTLVRAENITSELAPLFQTKAKEPVKLRLLQPKFGFWKAEGMAGEGLVVCLLDEQSAEIHSHGGAMAPRLISESLEQAGFVESESLKTTQPDSPWLSEIDEALVNAPTERSAKHLLRLRQLMASNLESMQTRLKEQPETLLPEIASALSLSNFGLHLTKPWKVVIIGQPNVGKSSLINALSGFDRAIVHDSPGTTRDVVSQVTAIEGWPVELTDTAGIRDTEDEIEQQGVERAISETLNADLRIALFDGSRGWSTEDAALLGKVDADLIVHNKCDRLKHDGNRPRGLLVSATQAMGLQLLLGTIASRLVPVVPADEHWFPVNDNQRERLEQLVGCLDSEVSDAISTASELIR